MDVVPSPRLLSPYTVVTGVSAMLLSWMEGSLTRQLISPGPGSSTTPDSTKFEFTLILLLNDVVIITLGAAAAITINSVDATACLASRATVTAKVDWVPAEAVPAVLLSWLDTQEEAAKVKLQIEL